MWQQFKTRYTTLEFHILCFCFTASAAVWCDEATALKCVIGVDFYKTVSVMN